MKKLRSSIFFLGTLLFTTSTLRAQDFSKYRGFPLGASLTTVLKQTDRKSADVNVAHAAPSLIQEVTWWPPNLPGTSYRCELDRSAIVLPCAKVERKSRNDAAKKSGSSVS